MHTVYAQQSPQFTQFMFNNLAINPAYAGADGALSLTAVARSQWTGVDGAPVTESFAAHGLFRDRVGLGLSVVNDQVGVHRNTNALASYAYHLKAGKRAFISLGLAAGMTNFVSDYLSLNVANDPRAMSSLRGTRMNLGTGLYFRSPGVDLGLSAPNLLSRRMSISDTTGITFRSPDILGYARYRLKLNENYTLQPAVLLKYYAGLPVSYDVNGSIIYKNVITAGLSYRSHESFDFLIKLQLTLRMEFGYSFDYPIGKISSLSSASHEVMVHYVFKKDTRRIMAPR